MKPDPDLIAVLEIWHGRDTDGAEQRRLFGRLESDVGFRQAVAEELALLAALRAVQAPEPRWPELHDLIGASQTAADVSFDDSVMQRVRAEPAARRPAGRWWLAAAAVTAAAALVTVWIGAGLMGGRGAPPAGAAVPAQGPPLAFVLALDVPDDAEAPAELRPGETLSAGPLVLAAGSISLQTVRGVTVTLEAPLRARLLSPDLLEVSEGQLRAKVPRGGEGFMVRGPEFRVEDLGTEFAAEVKPDGSGRVRVFDGAADVALIDGFRLTVLRQRLTANRSVRVDPADQQIEEVEEDDDDYPQLKLPPRPLLVLDDYPRRVWELGPAHYWRFETMHGKRVPNAVPDRLPLEALGSAEVVAGAAGNSVAALTNPQDMQAFILRRPPAGMLRGDFTIAFWAQGLWPQSTVLVSTVRFDARGKGNALLLQTFAGLDEHPQPGYGLHFALRSPPAWVGGDQLRGDAPLMPLRWHHIAAARQGGKMMLHLDGVLIASGPAPEARLNFTRFVIGRQGTNPEHDRQQARAFVGCIDEFAIFNRALTSEEVSHLAAGARSLPNEPE